jgi:hypothetical protein
MPGTTTDAYPGLREMWEARKAMAFSPEFVEYMDENVVNH